MASALGMPRQRQNKRKQDNTTQQQQKTQLLFPINCHRVIESMEDGGKLRGWFYFSLLEKFLKRVVFSEPWFWDVSSKMHILKFKQFLAAASHSTQTV